MELRDFQSKQLGNTQKANRMHKSAHSKIRNAGVYGNASVHAATPKLSHFEAVGQPENFKNQTVAPFLISRFQINHPVV
jgi:hypothetical protein